MNFPFWEPFGWLLQLGWILLLITVVPVLWVGWVILDWLAPPNTARRRFVDRFIMIG